MVELGELIRSAKVRRAGSEDFPLLSMTMRDGLVDQADRFSKRIAGADLSSYKVIERGQLVVGFPIDEGVLDFQMKYAAAIVSPAYGVWDIADMSRTDPRYLAMALRSPRALSYYRAKLRGSTARRRSLPASEFLAQPISLPPLDEQRRIAAILDQADAIRTKRRQMLAHLDDLTRAIFHEMFDGESYSEIAIGEFASVSSGSTPSRANASNFEGTVPWVKTAEVLGSEITATREHISDRAVAESRLKIFPPGAIVMAMYGQGATRGRCGILGIEATVNQACAVIQPNDRDLVRSGFLFEQLKGKYESIRRLGEGGNQPNLNKARVAGIKVIVPPAEVQDEFVSRLNGINALRQKAQRTLAADDEVFASLQSRVFCGER